MIVDLDDHPRAARFTADVCVVGTGAAALTLASVLLGSGVSVMFLESGGRSLEAETQRLNVCEAEGALFEGAVRGRKRMYGGSTECWGGQLLPLEPGDFEARSWVGHSGWPFGFEELAPYYRQALRFAGADSRNFDSDICAAAGIEPPVDGQTLRYFFSKWSPHPRLLDVVGQDLEESDTARVFLHANVVRLVLAEGGSHVTALDAVNNAGSPFSFTAPTVVLCTGGIEAPRLLLASNQPHRAGIGNAEGLVGRFFQDHPSLVIGAFHSRDRAETLKYFDSVRVDGVEMSPRLALSPELQAAHAVLSASAFMDTSYPPTVLRRAMVLNLLRATRRNPRDVRDLVDATRLLGPASWRLRRQGKAIGRDQQFAMTLVTEQEPSSLSRITLSDRRDRFGVRLPRIAWHKTDRTWATVRMSAQILQEEIRKTGLGELELFPHVRSERPYWRVFPHDLYHHMGATRMSSSPKAGVVDEHCRVFGVDNLYVASGSVFPTGGHSNCTLTIMALALRLADHLGLGTANVAD